MDIFRVAKNILCKRVEDGKLYFILVNVLSEMVCIAKNYGDFFETINLDMNMQLKSEQWPQLTFAAKLRFATRCIQNMTNQP